MSMENWDYEVGDCVDHISGGVTSEIRCRSKTLKGVELYGIIPHSKPGTQVRAMRGAFLRKIAAGSGECEGCRFWVNGECTRPRA